jgi:hypothetical protein
MVDVAGALLTAGLSLASKLIVSWVEHGRSRVKVAEVESSIAREAAEEAARLRVRVDDLERATFQMMRELVARTPQISYSRSFTGPVLDLQFDPHNPASSKQMLNDLRFRVGEISADMIHRPQVDKAGDTPRVIIEPEPYPEKEEGGTAEKRRSAEMLEKLRDRVRDAEDRRR